MDSSNPGRFPMDVSHGVYAHPFVAFYSRLEAAPTMSFRSVGAASSREL
jgi:hypothetical protein